MSWFKRFRRERASTEADYDYVYVKDAAGTILATYHGDATVAGPITSPCITSSTGSVQFTSDAAVTAPGFTVDAVQPCQGRRSPLSPRSNWR